ncbi:hypothetical protein GY21_01170 [Cryobacterium roopkundense]|uniref:Uncharacterized protein n=1 Tax=Cryobacterium roopkundense TaxID=1001240 RepID=A0A099JWF4_9MICO|nr:hypothetical protein [Cryobacterium roopkundense]KGJ81728.1 hypothetical protein GY21_01170 [Cryobacterium roopkundense]MBB5642478.1 hypothetical protein [Cryobacterium roopkundense]
MTIHENDVRRSARELRSLLLGLGGTHEPAVVEKSRERMSPTPDPLLAARLVRVQAELDATKALLEASLLREAALRADIARRNPET